MPHWSAVTADFTGIFNMHVKGSAVYRRMTLVLSFAAVVVFANLHALQPLLPTLAQQFSLSALQTSWSYAVGTLTLGLSLLLYSALSDALGRRLLLGVSFVGMALSTLALTQVQSFEALLWLRALQGFFLGGLPAIAVAYLGEELTPEAMLSAVATYISASSLGGISGRLLAGLSAEAGDWRLVFWLWGLASLLLLYLFWRFLPASSQFVRRRFSSRQAIADYLYHLRQPVLLLTYLLGGLSFFIFSNLYTYIAFVLAAPPYQLGPGWIGLLFLTYLTGTAGSALSSRVARGFGAVPGMMLGVVLMMLGTVLTLGSALAVIVTGFFVSAFGFFLTHSLATSWVSQHASRAKASASALYLVFYYVGASTGGIYLHWFWDWLSWPGVVLGALLGYSVVLGLCVGLRRVRIQQQQVVAG